MVKGVNKTVIEVNNTGSKVFNRIVFYVSPDYGNLSTKQLSRAVSEFTFRFDERTGKGYKTLRRRMIIKRRVIAAACAVSVAIALAILAVIIF